MKPAVSEYKHIEGKTYSLFGQSDYTAEYYSTISDLADRVMATHPDIKNLVDDLQRFSSRRKRLRHVTRHHDNGDPMHHILRLIDPSLGKYTENVEQHLKKLPLRKWWDRRLATSREQYHLYMLEIELTNRVFAEEFRKAHRKIALLPYCLQDFSVSCMSEKAGFDYQCRHCSAKCYQNHASMILERNNIEPYIWSGGNMKQLEQHTAEARNTLGILGIACVPELTFGMRSVRKKGLPVVGIPLNANRCIRWFGEFFPNSVDLEQLSRLVTAPTLPEL
jgi:hypothetical protein